MVLKRLQFYISILLLQFILVLFYSCDKKNQHSTTKKKDFTEIDKLLSIGQKLYKKQHFDSSYYYYNKAKNAAEIKKDTSRIIHSLSWMAEMQRNQGDYTGSESTSIEALPYIENSNKYPYGQTNIYIGLGNNYLYTIENDKAIYYFKKAINSKTDELTKASILNNISKAYTEKGEYNKAIKILLSLSLKKELKNNPEYYSRINDNLGDLYNKTKNNTALYYLNQGLKIRKQNNDNWGMIGSYYHLSEYYKDRNTKLSNKYALIAYQKSTKIKSIELRLESLKLLIENGKGDQLKKYTLQYLKINDSITKVRQKAKNQFAKIKYDSKKEKDENIRLKEQKAENILQLEIQKNKTYGLYFIILLILIATVLIYYYQKLKSRREKIEATYTTEIKIAKKLHDELANDVYQIMKFAETQDLSTENNKEILLNNLDTVYSRTRNISKENSNIETGIHFKDQLKEMMSDFNTSTTSIISNGLDIIHWEKIEETKKISIYRIVQELLVNMKKHSQSSLVVISFKINKNIMYLDYSDNGIGFKNNKVNKKNGLKNVENRVLAIKGNTTFDTKSNKGFKVKIIFPI